MAKQSSGNGGILVVVALVGILLLLSLAGNVVLLTMLNNSGRNVTEIKALQQETAASLKTVEEERDMLREELAAAQEMLDKPVAAAPEAVPAPEATEEPSGSAPVSPEVKSPDPVSTPVPTEEPKKLDFEPADKDVFGQLRQATVVSTIELKVRSGPGTNYAQLGTVDSLEELNVKASVYDWFFVEYESGEFGWVSGTYLFADWMFDSGLNNNLNHITKPSKYLNKPEKINTTSDNNNARTGPATGNELVSAVPRDRTFVKLGTDKTGDWFFGNFTGTFGWIHKNNFK